MTKSTEKTDAMTEADVKMIRAIANQYNDICINIIEFTDILKYGWGSDEVEWFVPETKLAVIQTGFYGSLIGSYGKCKMWVSSSLEPGTIRAGKASNPKLPTKADNYTNWTGWDEPTDLPSKQRTAPNEEEPSVSTAGLLIGGTIIGALVAAACQSTPEVRVAEIATEDTTDQTETTNEAAR
jgi:hypothetical protein